MLVLSRQENERLIFADPCWGYEIAVMVTEIRGERVRLGIEAPIFVNVRREELSAADWAGRSAGGSSGEG
jgi:carbon storage regulator